MIFSSFKKQGKSSSDPFVIQSGKFKDGKVPSYKKEWQENVFIPESGGKETIGKNFNFSKLFFINFFIFIFIFILLSRAAWLQFFRGEYYGTLAEGNRVRIERIDAKRGIIYDSEHRPVVRNEANFLLYFVPADLPEGEERNKIINKVCQIIGGDITVPLIEEKLSKIDMYSLKAYSPLFIDDNIEYEKAMKLYLESANWPGVILSNKSRREYLYTSLPFNNEYSVSLSHILGYTGKINEDELQKFGDEYLPIDYIGKIGIEYFWENKLNGKGGEKQIEVDALGKEKNIVSETKAQDGNNLVLSLNLDLQTKLEKILLENLKKIKLTKASAVVLDTNNGEVLAIVGLPAYDNNLFARGITSGEYAVLTSNPDKPLYNRVISGNFPSGSVIKPVIAVAALQEGIITEHTSFLSTGGLRIGQWFFPDWRAGGHGVTDVRSAIANSVNTFFYYVGGGYEDFKGLGVERITQYCELFGLGAQTGIDLAGESSGFLPSKGWKEEAKNESWYIGDTYHLAIGQGDLLVTPLQVALYTSVFANGGTLYRPHLVKEILSGNDAVVEKISVEPIRSGFISDYNMSIVRQGMRQTVTVGSARSLLSVPVSVAGKTGTAQWSTTKATHAWFTGFAPYDNPEIVITILIEEGGEGSANAVPVAREFLTWYFGEYKKAVDD
ncbi:MAG: penicillin-binding protein 2 [bacterium]